MPKHYLQEFKHDVVAVARSSGLTQAQVARGFGVSDKSVARGVQQANVDDGLVEGATSGEQADLVALGHRARVLEQEVEILRRATAYFAKVAAQK